MDVMKVTKDYLNSCHNNIKTTIEFEQNNAIPFSDILVTRNQNNTFTTSIYRKKTFTGHVRGMNNFAQADLGEGTEGPRSPCFSCILKMFSYDPNASNRPLSFVIITQSDFNFIQFYSISEISLFAQR